MLFWLQALLSMSFFCCFFHLLPPSSQVTYLLNSPYNDIVLLLVVFSTMILWVNGQKYESLLQFNTSWLASLRTWYFNPPKTINQEKTKNSEMRSNFQQIVSYCLFLCTQNPGLREVHLEPSSKRGSDKINMQKQGRNTQKKASCIAQPGLTYGSHHLER